MVTDVLLFVSLVITNVFFTFSENSEEINDSRKIELKYTTPYGWLHLEASREGLVFLVPDDIQNARIILAAKPNRQNQSLKKQVSQWLEAISYELPENDPTPLKTFPFGKTLGVFSTVQTNLYQEEVQVYYYFFNLENTTYLIVCYAYTDALEEYLPVFDQFIQSIRFKKNSI